MHNTTNKLISSIIGLLSIVFIFNNFAFAANSYLEPVKIPAYDSSNPSHLLITLANGKWTSANLNSSTYKHFYVEAGYYGSSTMTLTADGTANDRRSISLYNENDIHPAALPDALQANVRIVFNNASYWDIDRMSNIDDTTSDYDWFYNGSSYNTLNRHHLKNYYYGIIITNGCHYNTIQDSYINHMTHAGRVSDNVGIALHNKYANNVTITGTKIINNDIRNANDGVQLVRNSHTSTNVYYDDTIIDSNNMWYDSDVYTNNDYSTNGYNSNGQYQVGEQPGIDFKVGASSADHTILFTNNRVWGARDGDDTAGQGNGSGIVMHSGGAYINIENNIIFDSYMIGGGNGLGGGGSYSSQNISHKNNIYYDIGNVNPKGVTIDAQYFYNANTIQMENNTYVNLNTTSSYHRYENSSGTMKWNNNLMINVSGGTSGNNGAEVTGNYYYNTHSKFPKTGTEFIETTPVMGNYNFTYERFTASPKNKILMGVISTSSSPHYGIAGSSITEGTPEVIEEDETGSSITEGAPVVIEEDESGKMWILDPKSKTLSK